MSTAIEVKPETARKLISLAQSRGVSVEDLLCIYVPGLTANGNFEGPKSQAERIHAFIEWAKLHPTSTPILSEEAVRRRSFYED